MVLRPPKIRDLYHQKMPVNSSCDRIKKAVKHQNKCCKVNEILSPFTFTETCTYPETAGTVICVILCGHFHGGLMHWSCPLLYSGHIGGAVSVSHKVRFVSYQRHIMSLFCSYRGCFLSLAIALCLTAFIRRILFRFSHMTGFYSNWHVFIYFLQEKYETVDRSMSASGFGIAAITIYMYCTSSLLTSQLIYRHFCC